jgi:hypothetical protein
MSDPNDPTWPLVIDDDFDPDSDGDDGFDPDDEDVLARWRREGESTESRPGDRPDPDPL